MHACTGTRCKINIEEKVTLSHNEVGKESTNNN